MNLSGPLYGPVSDQSSADLHQSGDHQFKNR